MNLNKNRKEISVRLLLVNDAHLISDFFINNSEIFTPREKLPGYIESYLNTPTKFCFGAVLPVKKFDNDSGEQIIGFMSLDIIGRPRGGCFAYLGEVIVQKNYRRQGVAAKFIEYGKKFAIINNCHRIVLHCSKSIMPLYTNLGFCEWETGMCLNLLSH